MTVHLDPGTPVPPARAADTYTLRRGELDSYLRQMMGAVSGLSGANCGTLSSTFSGDVGVLTGWPDQDYTFEGNAQHISAPTIIVLRREGAEWKVAGSTLSRCPSNSSSPVRGQSRMLAQATALCPVIK